jgi:hypothetical protein
MTTATRLAVIAGAPDELCIKAKFYFTLLNLQAPLWLWRSFRRLVNFGFKLKG